MVQKTAFRITAALIIVATIGACGPGRTFGSPATARPDVYTDANVRSNIETNPNNTIWSIFNRRSNETNVLVNKYLWSASLEVLNFLPVQSVDPFTGVIVTGYGTPPGGGRSYRATVLIDDPALDARSLNVALQTRGGAAVSRATSRAVEDAILSRARELRIRDNKL
ncbi:DUF3576 domain-containing protein [Sulfitobacter aestuariivivens]|uniref:DUF3576 domain-containing protein n=1 Tax=Sulfitobacter aestuariivivens TaxID=2766981 RepID=A0A927D5Q1_9RHOB|nr:DUF3576 domain-containing protein [Sulfitobacter aestuariivivens]MBD3665670.1 DUF3576 domain-containing protein [Sulfitobacter aestuariivivens]